MFRTRTLVLPCLTLTAGPCLADSQPVAFLDMTSEVPADWIASEPSSDMRLLQFTVPAADDAGAPELVVYYFGPDQGGSLEANVARWTSQFSADGGSVEPVITPLAGDLPATLVELTGSYARGVGVGPVGEALPNRTLLAGVVETPRGNLYPQLYGPADVVAKHKAEFVDFITGISQIPSP
ncbi:MAG: hypothetical protein WBM40_04180 [Thiohalocapsa sp.]